MGKSIALSLIRKYLSGSCTASEAATVEHWFDLMDAVPDHISGLTDEERALMETKIFERILRNIEAKSHQKPIFIPEKSSYSWKVLAVAASLFLCLSMALLWMQYSSSFSPEKSFKSSQSASILPGGNKAVLTLDDGSSLVLTDANLGKVADQYDVSVVKTAEGELSYKKRKGENPSEMVYNTITTPVGGKYSVILPDGSKVWLNAKSSLRFPTSFTGAERNVQMTGEVYFEVVKNPKQPFKVRSGGTEISVLGTHFNVMAYDDEADQKTTLLEGSIHLSSGNFSKLLKPGQQASVNPSSAIKVSDNADLEAVMAWRNDLFIFKDMEIKEIARQLSRWYDIRVVFKGTPSKVSYTGTIAKDVALSEMLSMLQFTGLKYELNDHVLTIIE
ncbi:FecR family protein [Pedobacter sp. MR22-3]|uniref:FecR family protein n=1 Tax=Pedobacter sp. MR22-3 TaxID=2994552 RepID=UPI0022458311|nr:FecR family protein [Pedobacter sp. MR22-3]MCX2584698.1 FecR domain-containing protein [Pedobacter sp. MR22-3]